MMSVYDDAKIGNQAGSQSHFFPPPLNIDANDHKRRHKI